MSAVTIWHNPRCSKSRSTLGLLTERGLDPEIVKYLNDAPSIDQIRAALALLDIPAIKMMRAKEPLFKELGLNKSDNDEILINAMANHSKLIERPIVFANGKAAIGRPPESVLEIL